MLRKTLLCFLFLGFLTASGQNYLNFAYVIEAGVFKDDSLTYFIAHEYPVFQEHPDDSAASALTKRFRSGYQLESYRDTHRFEALTALPAISDDAFMGPDALLELLRNRLGMSKSSFASTPHLVDIQIHSVRFPNHQQPYFNHQQLHATRINGSKRFKQEKKEQVIDWTTGEPLTLGKVGGESSRSCVIKAIEQLNLEDDDCQGRSLEKQLDDFSYCDWHVHTIEASYVRLDVSQIDFSCKPEEEAGIEIPRDCLNGEGECE